MLSFLTDKVPEFSWAPEYDILPTEPTYGVRALFFRGMDYKGKKTRVFAYYGAPEHKEGERVPAIVLVHGGCGTAYDVWIKQWCDRGYAAIAIDTRGFFPTDEARGKSCTEGKTGMRMRCDEGECISPPTCDEAVLRCPTEEMWLYHAISAVILSHSILRSFPEIDTECIGILGSSWGGVLASHTIAYDRRFAFAIAVYGSAFLSTGDSKINRTYRNYGVDNYFNAQKGLDTIPFPVLWMCHDSDCNFSIDANTRSYLATRHAGSVLTIANMGHSASCTWRREEPFFFADSATGRGNGLGCRIITEPQGFGECSFKISVSDEIDGIRAICHYLDTPMSFDETGKYAYEWKHIEATVENDTVSFTLPENAMSYYVSLEWIQDGKRLAISTCYIT